MCDLRRKDGIGRVDVRQNIPLTPHNLALAAMLSTLDRDMKDRTLALGASDNDVEARRK
jgi:hypothetical protein